MLLAIDTSTRTVGVALYDGVQVVCETVWVSRDYHTVELAPAVADTLQRAALTIADLHAVAVAIGPGSFTGLRIGLALAKGIALARHLPLIGIPTLDIVAASVPINSLPLAAILHAGRGRLAVGWYCNEAETWQACKPVRLINIHRLSHQIQQPTLICGELSEEERRILTRKYKNVRMASPAHSVRRPALLAELAWQKWQTGHTDNPATLTPLYLHLPDIPHLGDADRSKSHQSA